MGRLNIMYILNPNTIKKKISCSKRMADYLVKNNFPILGKEENIYYFADIPEVKEAMDSAPFLIKILAKTTP